MTSTDGRTAAGLSAYFAATPSAMPEDLYRLRDCQNPIAASRNGGAWPVASAYCRYSDGHAGEVAPAGTEET